jgi:hypothetical protein
VGSYPTVLLKHGFKPPGVFWVTNERSEIDSIRDWYEYNSFVRTKILGSDFSNP